MCVALRIERSLARIRLKRPVQLNHALDGASIGWENTLAHTGNNGRTQCSGLGCPGADERAAQNFGAINNVPMTLVMISALGSIQAALAIREVMLYATIFGAALTPDLTTVGSLATMLWVAILRRKGLDVSPRAYMKLGVAVVPLMIVAGAWWIASSV